MIAKAEFLRHPRVVLQGLFASADENHKLAAALPSLTPFKGQGYAAVMWVLDWDHRLPSRHIVLRALAYYSDEAYDCGVDILGARQADIVRGELFPEFDVPDLSGLPADEAYEAELPLGGVPTPGKLKLVSEWRRQIDHEVRARAEDIVRRSAAFKELSSQVRARPPGLGDLEAAEWCPPSESGHGRWGVDVWYLRAFNGMVGEGTAFFVDVTEGRVVLQREFQFRAG